TFKGLGILPLALWIASLIQILCSRNGSGSYPTIRAYPKLGRYANFGKSTATLSGDLCVSKGIQAMPSVARLHNAKGHQRQIRDQLSSDIDSSSHSVASELGSLGLQERQRRLCAYHGPAVRNNGPPLLQHLSGQSVYNLESSVKTHYSKKRDKARVFYGYHSNQFDDDEGGGGGGWQRVVINDGSGQFFTMGDGMPFQFRCFDHAGHMIRALHFVFKVGDRFRTAEFYRKVLGMRFLRHEEFTEGCAAHATGRWSKSMVGYGPEDEHFVLELTYNYGIGRYAAGNDFAGIVVSATRADLGPSPPIRLANRDSRRRL
uniref:VOC domain-containing protein n=1 Tax=Macrostomum lignano TaxID=282301 RepID=A0A1I8FC50_9PLAT